MKHLTRALDRIVLTVLSMALASLFLGMLLVAIGTLRGTGSLASAGMACAGAGAMVSLISAFWVHREA
jgi:hypothetical protein